MQDIDPATAREMLASEPDSVLLDVREPWELQIAAVDGAVHIPMQDVPDQLERLPSAASVLVLCHHGNRSRVVARYLEQNGYPKVFNLAGGIEAWARDLDPDMAEY